MDGVCDGVESVVVHGPLWRLKPLESQPVRFSVLGGQVLSCPGGEGGEGDPQVRGVVGACGLAAVLVYDGAASRLVHENSCSAALEEAGGPLLDRAVRSGQVRATVTVHDLVALAVGVTLATEGHSDPGERAR